MKFWYYDLDEQPDDRVAVLRIPGSAANVILLDPLNFYRYRNGQSFSYLGGYHWRTPVRLEIPGGEHWYLVIDDGGYGRSVRAELQVLTPHESGARSEPETMAAGSRP